jgi:hypothetical protein
MLERVGTLPGLRPYTIKQAPLVTGGGEGAAASLDFDNVSIHYVDCGSGPSIMGLNAAAFTVDALVYLNPAANYAGDDNFRVVSQGTPMWGNNMGWDLMMRPWSGDVHWQFSIKDDNGAGNCTPAFRLTVADYEKWYYLRARFDGSSRAYIQGYYDDTSFSDDDSWVTPSKTDVTTPLRIGAEHQVGSKDDSYEGLIAYIHLWDADKGALASRPTNPFVVDADTVARYTFSEGSGSTLNDDSGSGNHGTITGAGWNVSIPDWWSL